MNVKSVFLILAVTGFLASCGKLDSFLSNGSMGLADAGSTSGGGNWQNPGGDSGLPRGERFICHRPPGNPGNYHSLRVAKSAEAAHLNHGDSLGPCKLDGEGDDEGEQEE